MQCLGRVGLSKMLLQGDGGMVSDDGTYIVYI
jgi:hypothetical protein